MNSWKYKENEMIKLIASDIDGTLLQHGAKSFEPELFDVIRKLKEKGIIFVAASGRHYENIVSLFEEVKDEILYVADNGSMYTVNGELHIPEVHSRELVEELLEVVRDDEQCEIAFSCAGSLYVESDNQAYIDEMKEELDVIVTEDFLALNKDVINVSLCGVNGTDKIAEKYERLFGEKAHVVTSGSWWMDIMPFGVNKGSALQHLIEDLGIKPEECVAFGDQWNDAEMLKLVGQSYAMNIAPQEIQEFCTHTTDNVLKELKKILHQMESE